MHHAKACWLTNLYYIYATTAIALSWELYLINNLIKVTKSLGFSDFFSLAKLLEILWKCEGDLMVRLLLVESSVIFFYIIFLMHYTVIINYQLFWKNNFFAIKRKQEAKNCFKSLILSVFTSVASRLKSEQKEKEK